MQTATDTGCDRRSWLTAAALLALAGPAAGARQPGLRLLAAWDEGAEHYVGVLALQAGALRPWRRIAVPTRAHGLLALPDGSVLAIARRPGDWMLRWRPGNGRSTWHWADPGRTFNGHAALSADGSRVFTTETDTESGGGLVGVRDANTLGKRQEWPTHGIDAHELLVDEHTLLVDEHTLLVANGGVPTRPESGRRKVDLPSMDSSLVRLDVGNGSLRGQWRLEDRRLSLRHLALNDGLVGIALQAEHDDPAQRAAAPVLAVLEGDMLRTEPLPSGFELGGYGGDITPCERGFAVSATRAGQVAVWQPRTHWSGPWALHDACAVALHRGRLIAAGMGLAVLGLGSAQASSLSTGRCRLDNHWLVAG